MMGAIDMSMNDRDKILSNGILHSYRGEDDKKKQPQGYVDTRCFRQMAEQMQRP